MSGVGCLDRGLPREAFQRQRQIQPALRIQAPVRPAAACRSILLAHAVVPVAERGIAIGRILLLELSPVIISSSLRCDVGAGAGLLPYE